MRIVVLVGLPGSGKSSYLERLGVHGLSSDAIRLLLADDETDQTIHERVFQTMRYLLRQRLAIGRPVTYIDATNLTAGGAAAVYRNRKLIRVRNGGCVLRRASGGLPGAERGTVSRGARGSHGEMAARLVPPTVEEGFDRVVTG